jgi:DNA-binding MarR family transcriptional regulator
MTAGDPETWPLGRLLSVAARQVEHQWNAWLAEHGLTHAGVMVLHALDTGPLAQRQLAATSRVEEQTMSRVVDRLVRTGHVTRERDPQDRRRLVIRRSASGDRAFAQVQASGMADDLVARELADPDAFRHELLRLVGATASAHPLRDGREGLRPPLLEQPAAPADADPEQ